MFALALLTVVPAAPSLASEGPPPVLQPATHTSPDGRWKLRVDPTRRDGGGSGNYRLEHDGKLAWEGAKPWTFWEAVVSDRGVAAGYAYSGGWRDHGAKGSFHAVILAPDGEVRLDDATRRLGSNFLHTPPNPIAAGLFWQPELDRFVFRIRDPDVNEQRERWWCYDASSGAEVFRKRPWNELPGASSHDSVVACRAVRGTPLTLVQWRSFDWPRIAFSFALHDAEAKVVWKSGDLDVFDGQEDAHEELLDAVQGQGSLLDAADAGRFRVRLARTSESVLFGVERAGGGWKVSELERTAWKAPLDEAPTPKLDDVAFVTLEARETAVLEGGASLPHPVRAVAAFEPLAGELRFVRREPEREFSVVSVDLDGGVLRERVLVLPDADRELHVKFWPLAGRTWIATRSPSGNGARSSAWRIDETTGRCERLEHLDVPSIEEVAARDDGGFVLLATHHGEHTMSNVVVACDPQGKTLFEIHEGGDPKDLATLFSPEALACAPDGRIAVVDVIRKDLQLFDAGGKHLSTIDLESAFGRKPNYPSGVSRDLDGGWLVEDFNGTPSLYRLDASCVVQGTIAPQFANGRTISALARNARVAPDGVVWTSDGERLLRLGTDGSVDRVLGTAVDAAALGRVGASAIDVFGRALVQDRDSGAVHVFDATGKRSFVCLPEPKDFERITGIEHLAATSDGGVIVEASRRSYVRFGADGARIGKLEGLGGELVFARAGDDAFAIDRADVVCLGKELTPLERIERTPDDRWLDPDELAIAPDGALAVAQGGSFRGPALPPSVLVLQRREAAAPMISRAHALPRGASASQLALGLRWAVAAGYGDDAVLVRRSSGETMRWRAPGPGSTKRSLRFGFDPQSDDLLVLDAAGLRFHRFALPK